MPTHTSGMHRYHIKWTQLADLPAPLYGACVAVQDKKYIIVPLVVIVQLKMLYIKCIYVYDVSDQLGSVITMAFLTSLVES